MLDLFFLLLRELNSHNNNARQDRADRSLLLHTGRAHYWVSLVSASCYFFATKCLINTICGYEFRLNKSANMVLCIQQGGYLWPKQSMYMSFFWNCNLVWQRRSVSLLITERICPQKALSTCVWLFKAKEKDYLNCNDIVQCVHVSYLFTMITLFCLSDAVLSLNISQNM